MTNECTYTGIRIPVVTCAGFLAPVCALASAFALKKTVDSKVNSKIKKNKNSSRGKFNPDFLGCLQDGIDIYGVSIIRLLV